MKCYGDFGAIERITMPGLMPSPGDTPSSLVEVYFHRKLSDGTGEIYVKTKDYIGPGPHPMIAFNPIVIHPPVKISKEIMDIFKELPEGTLSGIMHTLPHHFNVVGIPVISRVSPMEIPKLYLPKLSEIFQKVKKALVEGSSSDVKKFTEEGVKLINDFYKNNQVKTPTFEKPVPAPIQPTLPIIGTPEAPIPSGTIVNASPDKVQESNQPKKPVTSPAVGLAIAGVAAYLIFKE